MDNKKTGEFIKQQRKLIGITQKELADKLLCTDKAISRWETGAGFPDVSLLLPLSKALGVSVNEILIGERIQQDAFVQKSDNLIINTIADAKKNTKKLHIIIYCLICLISLLFMYLTPLTAQPGDEMGVVFLIVIMVAFLSFVLGLTNISLKYKLVFPVLNVLMFAPSVFMFSIYGGNVEIIILYGAIFIVLSLIFVAIGTGLNYLFKKITSK